MKFVSKYKCRTCGAEVIIIRDFSEISQGRDWQRWVERHGCSCNFCHRKSPSSEQHQANCEQAALYAQKHCWPDLVGSEDNILEAEVVRMNVVSQIKMMLRFREINYVTTSFLGEYLAQHTDAEWWLQYENGKSEVQWAQEFAKFCNEKCIDLVRVYLRYLNIHERKLVDDYIINTPYMRQRYPAIYIQNRMRKGWPIDI